LEFASHSFLATSAGVRGGKTFQIEWTPPGTDVGEVVFHAAGNATNNNNANTGDRVYTDSHRISSANCTLTGTPSITAGGIGNAADFRTVIGPNSLISIFGTGFAPAAMQRAVTAHDLLGGRVPTEMACIAIEVDGQRSPLIFVSGGQINAQVPTLVREGSPAPVRVILNPGRPNEIRSTPAMVQVEPYSPALFTFNGRSVAGLNATANNQILADPSVIAGGVSASPGDIVVLFGTGFGVTEPVYREGEFAAAPLRDPITVTIGGVTLSAADVLYAGTSSEAPGFYQFNLRVPASATTGDLPVSIRIGSSTTQSGATIPVRR
jgi:uncharacterized protein (TIGR03437 family)